MDAFRIATLIVAPVLLCGCFSTPKEKTEYEKQIDAVPMPVTDAERLEQCRNFKRLADIQQVDNALRYLQSSKLGAWDYDPDALALLRRLKAMKCPGYGWFS